MSGPYYEPANYGLEIVAEVDYSDGCYQFNNLIAWRRVDDGALFYATDRGCSCPLPFEGHGLTGGTDPAAGLVRADPWAIAKAAQDKLAEEESGDYSEEPDSARAGRVADFIAKVMATR